MASIKSPESIAFGKRLRQARMACGCTQAELADKAGVSESTEKNYELGGNYPSARVLARLCKALAVDAAWLYGIYPKEEPVQCPLMEAAKQPAGKHEAETVKASMAKREKEAAMKAAREKNETEDERPHASETAPEAADLSEAIATVDQLIDAMDGLMKVMPAYLVEGNALREALQGDPNGDHAPAYISLLSSQPGVVNYYRDKTHMRELMEAGTISQEEYDAWFIGRREKLAHIAVKKQAGSAAAGKAEKPRLKCTAEKL